MTEMRHWVQRLDRNRFETISTIHATASSCVRIQG
jgi:hypothetical protein